MECAEPTWQEVGFSKTHETICVGVVLGFYQSPALFKPSVLRKGYVRSSSSRGFQPCEDQTSMTLVDWVSGRQRHAKESWRVSSMFLIES